MYGAIQTGKFGFYLAQKLQRSQGLLLQSLGSGTLRQHPHTLPAQVNPEDALASAKDAAVAAAEAAVVPAAALAQRYRKRRLQS